MTRRITRAKQRIKDSGIAFGMPLDSQRTERLGAVCTCSNGRGPAGPWQNYVDHLNALLAEDRRGDALELFMRLTGASDDNIAEARQSPFWSGGEALAHILAYDAVCLGNGQPPTGRLQTISQPTLVATGEAGLDPHTSGMDFFHAAADAIVAAIPHVERLMLNGQTHLVDPRVIAAVLTRFWIPMAGRDASSTMRAT